MKYCAKCGHELIDEAIVCTNCGCMTGPIPKKFGNKSSHTIKENSEHSTKAVEVFNFLFSLTTIISCFFVILALITAYVDSYVYSGNYISSDYRAEGISSAIALIFSLSSLGFGIASFVLGLVNRLRGEKLFSSITRFILGVLLFILTIVLTGHSVLC